MADVTPAEVVLSREQVFAAIGAWLNREVFLETVPVMAVEVPHGRGGPKMSWAATSGLWRSIGVAEGVVVALGFPLVRVAPKDWQAVAFRGHGKPATYADRKRLSLRLARERWPGAGLVKAKDQAIADALFVALAAGGSA